MMWLIRANSTAPGRQAKREWRQGRFLVLGRARCARQRPHDDDREQQRCRGKTGPVVGPDVHSDRPKPPKPGERMAVLIDTPHGAAVLTHDVIGPIAISRG